MSVHEYIPLNPTSYPKHKKFVRKTLFGNYYFALIDYLWGRRCRQVVVWLFRFRYFLRKLCKFLLPSLHFSVPLRVSYSRSVEEEEVKSISQNIEMSN